MQFHVLGLGAIGSLLSYHLRRSLPAGNVVTLIHKSIRQARNTIESGPSVCVENDGVVSCATGYKAEVFEGTITPRIPLSERTEENKGKGSSFTLNNIQDAENIESLFVTTQAHQTLPAIRRLSPRLSGNSTIVLLSNGMGIYEELVEKIFRNPYNRPHFILASNTHGAFIRSRTTRFNVVHTGVGEIQFGIVPDPQGRNFEAGFLDPEISPTERQATITDITTTPEQDPQFSKYRSLRNTVAALLLMENLHTSWRPMEDIQSAMRRKLVVNSVINPLTAVLGCRNGELFAHPAATSILRGVCAEASRVYAAEMRAQATAYEQSMGPTSEDDPILFSRLPSALKAPSLQQEVLRVAELTKGNFSSMLESVRRGSETEIRYMNGHLLRMGKAYNIRMPYTASLMHMLQLRSAIPIAANL
ncbi:2-dehydropantoate 2-reductase (Ketopantoate reductase) (KPA reductase) (KPR) [Stygiomarasmius scandens]|uniref:2-dehydropantoate 2-reductase n=1 Tax=Marasmiellus scandens TaxID=2682957 RepID=A0ABR1JQY2_9AGAR